MKSNHGRDAMKCVILKPIELTKKTTDGRIVVHRLQPKDVVDVMAVYLGSNGNVELHIKVEKPKPIFSFISFDSIQELREHIVPLSNKIGDLEKQILDKLDELGELYVTQLEDILDRSRSNIVSAIKRLVLKGYVTFERRKGKLYVKRLR